VRGRAQPRTVGAARAAAADWVARHAAGAPGFRGAFLTGSVLELPGDTELPLGSDVDVIVLVDDGEPTPKLGKLLWRDVLVEVTFLPYAALAAPDAVLTDARLAPSFRACAVLADPTGHLRRLEAHVAPRFAEPRWVRRRCAQTLRRIEAGMRDVPADGPFHDQVTGWLFPTGVTTHVVLVAALRNPTVRLRYVAARDVLRARGEHALYGELLRLLGCAGLGRARVAHHLDALGRAFDDAAAVLRTPFAFAADLTTAARPVAIDASRELVERGDHREAMFWIVATFARCEQVLAADAPPSPHAPAFRAAVADLGIAGPADLRRRAAEVTGLLPELASAAERVLRWRP